MSIARRRRRHLKWCRYLNRAEVPFGRWQHRAPGCDNPRPSGVARAWDRVALDGRRGWPWRPRLKEAPGSHRGWSAVMVHDQTMRRELRAAKYEEIPLPAEPGPALPKSS